MKHLLTLLLSISALLARLTPRCRVRHCRWMRRSGRSTIACISMGRRRCGWLGFPATESVVRLIGKAAPEACC